MTGKLRQARIAGENSRQVMAGEIAGELWQARIPEEL